MKSEWKVAYSDGYSEGSDGHVKTVWEEGYDESPDGRQKCYMVYRLKDTDKADDDENREIIEYTWNKERAQKLLSRLNTEYDNPQ